MRIVVLAGGTSTERDVSLVSGKMVYRALKENGHNAVLLDAFMGYPGEDYDDVFESDRQWDETIATIGAENPDPEGIKRERLGRGFFGPHVLPICQKSDIVFIALHGANGEDGKVQSVFDLFGIKYTGSNPLGAAISMDKGVSKQLLRERGIPTPAGLVVRKGHEPPEDSLPAFPIVVKVSNGGSSIGVYIAKSIEEYRESLPKAYRYGDEVIVEQYISGREFSVGIIDGNALPIIEIMSRNGIFDYNEKYHAGNATEVCPAELSPERIQQMMRYAEEAYEALHIDSYARIDVMMDEHWNMYVLEANVLPGMTPTSLLPQEAAAIGMDFNSLCERLIEVSLRKWEKNGA